VFAFFAIRPLVGETVKTLPKRHDVTSVKMRASNSVKKPNLFGPFFYASACDDRICRNGNVAFRWLRNCHLCFAD
jgi:hypothetical protein